MIARLRGRLESAESDTVVIDVGGVGYLVFCSARTLNALPGSGEPVSLHIETHVREDHIHLYGFQTQAERAWFLLLLTVQGVGARMALNVLSLLSPDEIATAIASQDRAALRQVSGVGSKLAARILAELKDKADGPALHPPVSNAGGGEPATSSTSPAAGEAVSALVNLGYGRSEAFTAVAAAARSLGTGEDLPMLIRQGLKELGAR